MKILIRNVVIADPQSPWHLQSQSVHITDGIINQIAPVIEANADHIIEGEDAYLSPGFIDLFAHACDPGMEHQETLQSLSAAAISGGYTSVAVIPNTNPVIDKKTGVTYITNSAVDLPVNIYPLGAVSKNTEGKELAEMYDMKAAGAVAFTDGLHPVQNAGLLIKALQYVKVFNGVVLQVPIDSSIGNGGLMHEGVTSTKLGLPGIPAMAEELIIARDIKLSRYTDSHIHFTGVSTPKSLEYIGRAKAGGLKVTCSVTPYHLLFCDEDLANYDTNLKVNPPLRSREDLIALKKAVLKGSVDCIASHHLPQHWDNKTIEFEYAKNGMTGLQTALSAVLTALPDIEPELISSLFAINTRNILSLPPLVIAEGSIAECTIWTKKATTTLTEENNKSKSNNTPLMDKTLNGGIIAVINKGYITIKI